jgi:acetyl esterase/lipase
MVSVQAYLTRFVMKRVIKPWLMSDDVLVTRRRFAQLAGSQLRAPAEVERVDAGGVPGEWLTPRGADPARVLYYLHGGGFVACSPATHRRMVARIALAAGVRALVIDYRLAPEHPFPAALDDSLAGYRFLLASGVRPEQIVIAGDSAGGNLTLTTMLALRESGEPLPAAGVCISPATDLTQSGDSFLGRADVEAMLSVPFCRTVRGLYLPNMTEPNPLASPLHAKLHGLPPLLVHVGTHEMLYDDSTRLVASARDAGVDVEFKAWEGMWHVFHSFDGVPEATSAVREVAAFIKQRMG